MNFLRTTVWVAGGLALILGLLLWNGSGGALTDARMVLGVIVVLALWALAAVALQKGSQGGLAVIALIWGLATPIVVILQVRLLPSSAHIIIQLVHLASSAGAMALGNRLTSRPQSVLKSLKS